MTAPLHGLLDSTPSVVTVGADLLAQALRNQGADVHAVEWRPPMAGTASDLATVLADPRRENANAVALQRMLTAGAELVDVVPASEAIGCSAARFCTQGRRSTSLARRARCSAP
jgi:hypothetical protein